MQFIYHGDAVHIGLTKPICDLHGRALVQPRLVTADDPQAAIKVTSGKAFSIDDKQDALIQFLRADPRFQRLGR